MATILAYRLESYWDLWQYDVEWRLAPTGATLACFGPEFDNGAADTPSEQEHLRIDLGVDITFLPQPEIAGSGRLVESNIKSLLRLVHEIEDKLPVRRRLLAAESGENFADRLTRLAYLHRAGAVNEQSGPGGCRTLPFEQHPRRAEG